MQNNVPRLREIKKRIELDQRRIRRKFTADQVIVMLFAFIDKYWWKFILIIFAVVFIIALVLG